MKLIKRTFWKLPNKLILPILKIRFKNKFLRPIHLSISKGLIHLKEENPNRGAVCEIYFYFPMRLPRYFVGIQERLEIIAREYCLDQIQEINSGVVIDIGSNIGEFTLIASQRFPNCSFLRFEPSLTECKASEHNLSKISNVLIQKPLWDKVVEIPFYESNDTGDSSIFQPNMAAKSKLRTTTTLDIEVCRLGIESVELLKLEAEGAEPEILEGAEQTLRITKRVTADLGPERGLNQERTFLKVNQILLEAGFALSGKNPGGRECYLYTR